MNEETKNAPLENLNTDDVVTTASLVFTKGSDAMEKWSDEKKNDFCSVFADRSEASAYILFRTGTIILDTAHRRQFVGTRAMSRITEEFSSLAQVVTGNTKRNNTSHGYVLMVGGRVVEELNQIAETRAEDVLKSLPPLKQAVLIIKPEVAKLIDKCEAKKELVVKLSEKLDDPKYSEVIQLSKVDQQMTIENFRKMVKSRTVERRKLVDDLNDAAQEAKDLEDEVAKSLYAGIPEISTVILDAARKHFERAAAMGGMTRRVQEHVKFGDSDAAVDMVKQFEEDETVTSASIKEEFSAALTRLKLSAPMVRKTTKQLAAKKEKKS